MNVMRLVAAGKRLMKRSEFDKSEVYFTTAIDTSEIIGWQEATSEATDLYYKSATEMRQIQALIYYYRGSSRLSQDHLEAAFSDLDRALELSPKLWPAQVERSLCEMLWSRHGHSQRAKVRESQPMENPGQLNACWGQEACTA
ncbi:MAG: hypothetical protein HQL52_11255 [Magnetococcales bacterium]|nr:hypothetical protein [Magnetococcales bacterium]